MNAAVLLAHFDRISDAPDAIPRLRQFILDLAVRGKLVEQDPNDEPASELLKRIQSEKARLIEDGEIRRAKSLSEIRENETPFSLPYQWAWCRLGSIINLVSGQHLQPNEYSGQEGSGIPYITGPADFGENGLVITRYALVRKAVSYRGQILVTVKGAGVGKTAICDLPEVAISRQLMAMTPIHWTREFLLITTHRLAETLRDNARSLIPGISREDVDSFVVPLPPFAEQQRIVAKVDELMSLCDQLEAAQTERERHRDRLATASQQRLTPTAADAPENKDYARFYLNLLPRLTTRPEQIAGIRQTILNLAVRGKLVPQDPNDEPASELVKRVRSRSAKATQADNEELYTQDSNVGLYEIPKLWQWTILSDITDIGTGSTPSRTQPSFWESGSIPWVTSGSTSKSVIMEGDELVTEAAVKAHRLRLFKTGTLLVALYGQGKTRGQVATLGISATINQACAAICSRSGFEKMQHYIKILLLKNYDEVRLLSAGGTQPNLNVQKIKDLFVPLPPLAEQYRIVAKVEELMSLCDELERTLTTERDERRRLLDAVLHEAIGAAGVK